MSRPASINLIAENCVAVRMRMLNRVVTNHYDELAAHSGSRSANSTFWWRPQDSA